MNDASQYRALCGWRGIDAMQKFCASEFSALIQTAPHLFGDSLRPSRSCCTRLGSTFSASTPIILRSRSAIA